MATIKKYKKKDGSTAYQFDLYLGIDPMTGKKKRTTRRGFKTQKEAKLVLAALELEVEKGELVTTEKQTFQQVYELWFKHYKNTVKESTYCKTEEQFRCRILPVFGHRYIDKIPVTICQQAIDQWASELVHFKVVMNYTSKIFEHAIKMGIATVNPTKNIIIPVKKHETIVQEKLNYYTKDELKQFMRCLNDSNNSMIIMYFRLLAFTGMRRGECLALYWSDINFTEKTLTISRTVAKGEGGKLILQSPKTRTSARTISIDDKTLEELKKWRINQRELYFKIGHNTNQENQLVFSSQENTLLQLTKPRKWLLQTINKYNLKPIGLHGFRHTFASLCFEAGATIKEVQEMLGHSSYKMTLDIYTHVTESKRQETAEKFSKYVGI